MAEGTVTITVKAKDKTGKVFSNALGSMQKLGKAAAVAGVAVVAAGGAVMVGIAAKGVMAFASFEDQMNEVFTLLPDISAGAMGQMRNQVLSLSEDMGRLPEEIIPALYQSLSAGVSQDNVFDFLDTAHKAALGGVADLEVAVDGITSVVNAYGAETMTATQASDLMFTAVRLGKTNFAELSASLSNVTPIASGMGVSFDDVTAGLAAMTAQGTPTAQATVQMRALLQELGTSGTEVADVFEDLAGKSFLEFIDQGGNTSQALQMIEEHAVATNVPIQDMFGNVRAGLGALQLTGKGAETFASNLDEMGASAGATEAAYETMNSGMARTFEVIKAKIATTFIKIGEALAPTVKILFDKLLPVLDKVSYFVRLVADSFGVFFSSLENGEGFLGAIENVLFNVADALELPYEGFQDVLDTITDVYTFVTESLIPGIINLKDTIMEFAQPIIDWITSVIEVKDVLIALGIVIGGVLLVAIYSIITAIAPVILIFAAIVAAVALVRHAWENNWLGIQEKTAQVIGFIRGIIDSALTWIKEFWAKNGEEIIAKATMIWETIKTIFVTAFEFYWDLIVRVMTWIKEFWAENGDEIMAKAKEIWDTIKNAIETVINTISDIITTVVTAIKEFWAENGDEILAKAKEIWEAIQEKINTVIDFVKDIIDAFMLAVNGDWFEFGKKMREIWDGLWEGIKTFFTETIPELLEKVVELITGIKDKFLEVDWAQIGIDIVKGIANGITGAVSWVIDAGKGVVDAAKNAILGFLDSDSPSKLFMEIGAYVPQGFALGIEGATSRVDMAMNRLMDMTVPSPVTMSDMARGSNVGIGIQHNYNLEAHYSERQNEGDILTDIRVLEKLRRI